jgi:transcription elongation factor GreA
MPSTPPPASARASSRGASRKSRASWATPRSSTPALLDADGRCVFGATVDLEDQESGAKVTYQIVGDDEADLKNNKISISSPIARALIGKYAGDIAEVKAPGGVREYEVLDVRYL